LLTRNEVEEANKAVTKVLESTSTRSASQGKYNSYTSAQRAEIGKYAAENGATSAAKHFSSKCFSVSPTHLVASLKSSVVDRLLFHSK